MAKVDIIYNAIAKDILENGVWDKDQQVRPVWADGTPAYTKSVISKTMVFDNNPETGELPILTTKKVMWLASLKECPIWMWQKKSNVVEDLRAMKVKIWNEWEIHKGKWKGTIGPSYGFQLGKKCRRIKPEQLDRTLIDPNGTYEVAEDGYIYIDQVDYLLHQLKHNPSSRRHITTLWNIDDLDEMALNPCVYETQWLVKEGKLHLVVTQRSADFMIGVSFNIAQYAILHRMIAQVIGLEVGTYTHEMRDVHIYERHLEDAEKQLELPQYEAPKLWINPKVKNFYEFTIDDFKLENYQCGPFIKYEIAI